MPTDTSERGLERLICTALAGHPCEPPASGYGGVGWSGGNPHDCDCEYCVDVVQLGVFLRAAHPEAAHAGVGSRRAGQGFDLIFRECIRESKRLPDFSHTDDHTVWLTLHGDIQDPEFLRFLEEIGREQVAAFGLDDFLVVDLVRREQRVPDPLRSRVEHLLEQGIIERVGRGRGVRLLLSRRFYRHIGKAGVYTRKRGLDRETNKELLLKHIQDNRHEGSRLGELVQVLPALSYVQVQKLLQDLRIQGRIHKVGNTNAARWYPGNSLPGIMRKK